MGEEQGQAQLLAKKFLLARDNFGMGGIVVMSREAHGLQEPFIHGFWLRA